MPFPNPDLAKTFQYQVASSMQLFGQTVSYKRYISASGGQPEYGLGDSAQYQPRPSQWQLRPLTVQEIQAVGGQNIAGGFEVFAPHPIFQRDEVTYSNTSYRIVSVPSMEQIGNSLYYRAIMAIGDTGNRF